MFKIKTFLVILFISLSVFGKSSSTTSKLACGKLFTLEAFVSTDSLWTEKQVIDVISSAVAPLKKCHAHLSWKILFSKNLPPLLEKSVIKSENENLLSTATNFPPSQFTKTIRLFFVNDFHLNGSVLTRQSGFVKAQFKDTYKQEDLPPDLINTVWIPYKVSRLPSPNHCGGADYSVLAHELIHILTGDGGHNNHHEANILSLCITGQRNNHLLPSQCSLVKNSEIGETIYGPTCLTESN